MSDELYLNNLALGVVSTQSFPAIVGIADAMVKAAAVRLLGYEMIGAGYCTAVVRGRVSDVKLSVEQGVETAQKFGQLVSAHVIPRPSPNLDVVMPIGLKLIDLARGSKHSQLKNLAVGLLETRGFPAMVGAADMMLKAADVHLADYEKIGDGLCTAIIRGTIANVAVAIEAGITEAERIGELNAVMVIPKPLDDLEVSLPVAECWIEQEFEVPVTIKQKEKEEELVELPNLKELQKQEQLVELPDLRN